MSKEAAEKVIENAIDKIISYNYRQQIEKNVHILNISLNDLMVANNISAADKSSYTESYAEFILAVERRLGSRQQYSTVENAVTAVSTANYRRGVVLVTLSSAKKYLVGNSFTTIRNFLTGISKAIPDNRHFGQRYRARTVGEYALDRAIDLNSKETSQLKTLEGKAFITGKKGKYVISKVIEKKENNAVIYVWKDFSTPVVGVKYRKRKGGELITESIAESKINWEGAEIVVEGNKIFSDQGYVLIEQTTLSTLDVGHVFSSLTPLRAKFEAISEELSKLDSTNYPSYYGPEIQAAVQKLKEAHALIDIEFTRNFSDTSTLKDTIANINILVVPQLFGRNAELAKIEAKVLRELRQTLIEKALDIPGSDTLRKEIGLFVKNKVLSALGLEVKDKLKKHQPVSVRKDAPSGSKIIVNTKNTKLTKTKKATSSSGNIQVAPIRNIQGQFFSLVALQRLLDATLVQRIKDNMGTGNRRDILNLRTGRFAESVKVENLSQSREGMITAFYSYMRNPYATFSQGGRQESPKTRDPKLLISQSIRQIGAAVVANRMRAVLV